MKNYEVTLTRVADTILVKANSEAEAKELAKEQINYSVWESVAEEVQDD